MADVRRGETLQDDLKKSNWFTRGWTLQELLAPLSVVFFDKDWIDVGTKASLEEKISEITGIDDFVNFEAACVAQKMSWASKRKTTRVEDMAYCLLGLFNVNMPPLYGEGEKAFTRLQLEVLKTTDDESIFAWNLDTTNSGLLAASPKYFTHSGQVRPLNRKDRKSNFFRGENQPFSMTNKGLYISLPLIREHVSNIGLFLAPLRCCWIGEKEKTVRYLAMHLLKTGSAVERYRRVRKYQMWSPFSRAEAPIGGLFLLSHDDIQHELRSERNFAYRYIYVNEERSYNLEPPTPLQGCVFSLSTSSLRDHRFAVSQYHPLDSSCVWENSGYGEIRLSLKFLYGLIAGMLFVNDKLRESIILAIVVRTGYSPCLFVITSYFGQPLEKTIVLLSDIYLGPALTAKGTSSNSLNSIVDSGGGYVADSLQLLTPNSQSMEGILLPREDLLWIACHSD